jgi:hypothetical protein
MTNIKVKILTNDAKIPDAENNVVNIVPHTEKDL